MDIKPIKNEKDYSEALKRIDEIICAEQGIFENDELEIMIILVESYEKKHYVFNHPDPVDAIKFRMEQIGLKKKDLAQLVGGSSRVSEILSKKRGLSLNMIRNLHKHLKIPLESLIKKS